MASTLSNLLSSSSILGRISVNVIGAGIAGAIARLVSLFGVAYLARVMGVDVFGKLAYAEGIAVFGMLISDVGLQTIGLREISKRSNDPASYKRIVDGILTIQLLTTFAIFVGISILSWFVLPIDAQAKRLIIIYSACLLFPYVPTIEWWLNGTERLVLTAILRLAREIIYVLILLLFVHTVANVYQVPLAQGIAMLATAGLIIWKYSKVTGYTIQLLFDRTFWLGLLRLSWPIGVVGVINHFGARAGILMLGNLSDDQQISFYAAPWRLYVVGMEVNALLALAVFPHLSRLFTHSTAEFVRILRSYQIIMLVLGLVTVVLGFILAPMIVQIVYGPDFEASAAPLRIFFVAAGLLLVGTPTGQALLATRFEKVALLIGVVSTAVHVLGNVVLISPMQATGAALSYALSIAVATGMSFWLCFKLVLGSNRITFEAHKTRA